MRIAVHGATGFTGGLVVAEAGRRGFEVIAVGRDEQRLRAAAPDAEIRTAGLDELGAQRVFAGCDVVLNCAGPFTRWGEPVLRAALESGCHYVDTTGEQPWVRRVLDEFGQAAVAADVTVVPALADDGGPGDLIAALTAARLASVAELLVADLRTPGQASRGTARSMAALLDLRPPDGPAPGPVIAPGEPDPVAVQPFPLPGLATIPEHVRARTVRSVVRAEVAALFGALTPDVAESVPAVPDPIARAADRWIMLTEATAPDGATARGWVTGTDPYRLTAVVAVEGAHRLATQGAQPGALTPAQAFDPASFLDYLAPEGVTWRVTRP